MIEGSSLAHVFPLDYPLTDRVLRLCLLNNVKSEEVCECSLSLLMTGSKLQRFRCNNISHFLHFEAHSFMSGLRFVS